MCDIEDAEAEREIRVFQLRRDENALLSAALWNIVNSVDQV